MKIVVTGGSGFLGSHIADALSDDGHEITILDQKKSQWLRPDQHMVCANILNEESVHSAIKGCDAIYHLAAVADIGDSFNDPRKTFEINVMGTLNLLEAAKLNNIKNFIFASTIYVYSNQGSFYRTSKRACEQLIEDYNSEFGLNYAILRFGSLYGPRANKLNAVFQMIQQALDTNTIEYKGTGDEIREYIHASDGAAAAVDMLKPEFKNQIIHVTGYERMTTRNMMEMIAEILGSNVSINVNVGEMPGHYFQTPYSYIPKRGRKLIRDSYTDIGLGLLDLIEHQHQIKTDL